MKRTLALLALAFFAGSATAADPAPKTPPAKAETPAFKSADEHWAHLQKLQERPTEEPKTREEAKEIFTGWLSRQISAAEAFLEAYPEDPRRWQVKVVHLRAALQARRLTEEGPSLEESRQVIDEILKAPDANAETKGEAAFFRVMMLTESFDEEAPETIVAFHKAAAEYLKTYGQHPLARQVQMVQLQLIGSFDLPENKALLKELIESKDAEISSHAKQIVARQSTMAELKTKPVPIKFTATDGAEINLEKMRGKVILVDFWASWCGPCITEMPNVVAAYEQYKPKGFEVIGISLDQDKAAMDAMTKKLKMSWPQYFDGKGWANEISTAFGINSIPATWLLDKKGMLRETDLRGEALGEAVKKLLAE